MVHFQMDWVDMCFGMQSNIPWSISVARGGKICNFHLYWDIFPEAKQYSPKYFGTNTGRHIPFSQVWSAQITPKANQYSLTFLSTKNCWKIPFSCVLSVHITLKAKQYSPKYFGTNSCRNVPFLCVLSAHITPKAKQYCPKYFGTNCCWKISFSHGFSAHVPWATNNIPCSISAPRVAEIFHFHVYLMHM